MSRSHSHHHHQEDDLQQASRAVANTSPLSLERKLELLESRFTQPANTGPTLPAANMDPPLPQQPLVVMASTATAAAAATSPSNLSRASSEHSFAFSTSLPTSSSGSAIGGVSINSNSNNSNSNNSNSNSQHSNLPSSSVRSKRRPSLNSSLHAVERAAARHLRKVRARSPVQGGGGGRSGGSNSMNGNSMNSNSMNNNSNLSIINSPSWNSPAVSPQGSANSQQTLLTSHVQSHAQNPQPQQQQHNQQPPHRVVAESPPVPVTPGLITTPTPVAPNTVSPKPAAVRNILQAQPTNSITTTTPTTNTNTNTARRRGSGVSVTGTSFVGATPTVTRATTTASNTKRKSVPKRKHASIQDKSHQQHHHHQSPQVQGAMASPEPSSNKRAKEASRSPRGGGGGGNTTTLLPSDSNNSLSRGGGEGRSNPAKMAKKQVVPPTNNRRIHDFFAAATTTVSSTNTTNPNVNNKSTTRNTTAATGGGAMVGVAKQEQQVAMMTSTTMTTATMGAAASSTVDWQAKYTKLEQRLQDKEDQLKAVSNNKTILHTALQSALVATKQEYATLQASTKSKQLTTSKVLEELLRWKGAQQAKELRSKLATDGARLGRIVYARAGMRALESWEEGYATKDLEHRQRAMKEKRTVLEARAAALVENEKDAPNSRSLQAVEAREALQMHLTNLDSQQQELTQEDQALNDEKGRHIRALKRVASEDASRFRSRPKLHDRYVLHCLLGKGGFSEVWRGYDLLELREVAVKIHQLDPRWPDSKKENYTKHVSREYEIHRNVRHARIVSLFDVFEIDNNSFATVLECCQGTDLDTLLKQKKRLPERQARALLLQILSGMSYLTQPSGNRQGIIHYDLKPGNILFDEFGDAKITDFGLSKIVDTPDPAESMELTSQGAGTYWYLPPECFITTEKVRISNKVDVWSIGVIYYQMLYGARPFGEGKSQDKLLSDHTMLNAQQVHFPDHPSSISESAKGFIRQCLMYDQAFRPTIAQLCEHSHILSHDDGPPSTMTTPTH